MPETKPPILSSTYDTTQGRKPWYRLRNVALTILAILVGVIAYAFYWQASLKPNPIHDYERELVALSEAAQPEGENGWPHLLRAGDIVQGMIDEGIGDLIPHGFEIDFDALLAPTPDDAEHVAAIGLLIKELKARGAIEALDRAATCPRQVKTEFDLDMEEPFQGPLMFTLLPEISRLRLMQELLVADMYLQVARGDQASMVRSFERAMFIADACSRQPIAMFSMLAHRMVLRAITALLRCIAQLPPSGLLSDELNAALDEMLTTRVVTSLEGERIMLHDLVQHYFSDDGDGDGILILDRFDETFSNVGDISTNSSMDMQLPGGNFAGLMLASRAETTAEVDEFYSAMRDQAELSPLQRRANPFDDSVHIFNLGFRHRFLQSVLPALRRLITNADRVRCELRGTRIVLAIEQYRHQRGVVPRQLADLVPDYLDAVPANSYTEAGFVYREMTPSEVAISEDTIGVSTFPYLLYSVGPDGEDNDGEVDPDSQDYRSMGRIGKGYDLLFTPQR